MISLIVDDFGVEHANKERDNHLVAALEEYYEATSYWKGKKLEVELD